MIDENFTLKEVTTQVVYLSSSKEHVITYSFYSLSLKTKIETKLLIFIRLDITFMTRN